MVAIWGLVEAWHRGLSQESTGRLQLRLLAVADKQPELVVSCEQIGA